VDHDERREFLASVSAELIAEYGLEHATIREIAARTGYSRGVIEHYFDDKNHLITAALLWVNDRYVRREDALTQNKRGLAALAARLRCAMPLCRESVQEWKIRLRFWSLASYREDLQKILGQRLSLTRERFLGDLRAAAELGEIAVPVDLQTLASLLVHTVSGASSHALIAPDYYNKRYLQTLVDNILTDLRNGGTGNLRNAV
jgi:AcrR family transcriptional regulator